ncbi:MAG: hypothetical protein EON58_21105 [Alphaproteobacteria bacterium]|nr:MAG: hypothetical protein EON58_21105 [Alphaproteobacteria bacterium]
MSGDRIVSIGFLTENDVRRLGATFSRHIPIEHDDIFAELLAKLDEVEMAPLGKGIVMMPHKLA